MIYQALNGLIQDMWAKQKSQESTIAKKKLTMIRAIIKVKDEVVEGFLGLRQCKLSSLGLCPYLGQTY